VIGRERHGRRDRRWWTASRTRRRDRAVRGGVRRLAPSCSVATRRRTSIASTQGVMNRSTIGVRTRYTRPGVVGEDHGGTGPACRCADHTAAEIDEINTVPHVPLDYSGCSVKLRPICVRYAPNITHDQPSPDASRRGRATTSSTWMGLQNLHPQFKSGRRLRFSVQIRRSEVLQRSECARHCSRMFWNSAVVIVGPRRSNQTAR
jgi:hypothetical protein